MKFTHLPPKQGLYDPQFEHDNCGFGFVCNVDNKKTNDIVTKGIQVLKRLSHRGATGADPKTGDGAGILIQIPHEFLKSECEKKGVCLPDAGWYGMGLVFLPIGKSERQYCENVLIEAAKIFGLDFIGWRDVPVNDAMLGQAAKDTEPVIKNIFLKRPEGIKTEIEFERKLYLVRKHAESEVRGSSLKQKTFFYITNLSCRTMIYKGLLMPEQLDEFFLDLKNPRMRSAFSLVHSRYSTNTFPTWDLAQPFRFLAHNGEINTLRGNINWMRARQGLFETEIFEKHLKEIFPVIVPGGSDSAALDNAIETLTLGGRSIAHAMMMLIPEAWQNNNLIDKKRKDFYEYHACLMEPWDGPAAIAFTDGRYIGATLDRNGLRPARYIITKDNMVVMASEVGVLDIAASDIMTQGRLQPGKMFLVDLEEKRIIDDGEIKSRVSDSQPYSEWIGENLKDLDSIPVPKISGKHPKIDGDKFTALQKAFGYSREDVYKLITPMAVEGKEPTGSMGDDTPLAVLSNKNRMLYDYFKQLFAQVTNPPIDPIREEIVMSLESYLGKEGNLLNEAPRHCKKIKVRHPVLTNDEIKKIYSIQNGHFKTKNIYTLFEINGGKASFRDKLNEICAEAVGAIKDGCTLLVLSDRGVNERYGAIPALLSLGAVHHHLIRKEMRTQVGIIVESGEPREVTHYALLFGYGADCINPYLAYETIDKMTEEKEIDLNYSHAKENYIHAVEKGILKILSKMGISTLQSYRGAQIFEALGLNNEVVDMCFTGTVSRIGGIGIDIIAEETISRHKEAYAEGKAETKELKNGGLYQWRRDGEFHMWNPDTIFLLQQATRKNDSDKYKEFASLVNNQGINAVTLRGLLNFADKDKNGTDITPIPLEEVEPASEIIRRFVTGAMSFGSISKEAHETLATAMNRLQAKSNSGEGGEDPERFKPLPSGDSLCSAIKQVASGRFGVTINYLSNAKELQIKIAQGAKPGEGGQLPGHKVSPTIARIRYSTPGVTLISPPPHHDIYSIEDLAQLIFDLKNANPKARVSVKLVSEVGVGTIAAGVAKGHADMILISGGDGGTGASPFSSIKHAGLPWELGLSETHQTLVLNDLRGRVRIQTDGQMRTGKDVVVAAILGAEEYGFSTAALIVLGCTMLRHCHLNNCSLGVATQDDFLRKRFCGKPEFVINYFNFVAEEVRQIMARIGVRKMDDLIGRTDYLTVNEQYLNKKTKGVDFSKILYKPSVSGDTALRCIVKQDHGIDSVLDVKLIELSRDAIGDCRPTRIELPIDNTNRTVGAMLSGEVTKVYGENGLSEDTIHCVFKGTAGQSFGAFLAKGITLELSGNANDYVGKCLSGGKIIIYPPKEATFRAEENIIVGNTTFYGATSGEAYIRGVAGERFCIRNSGIYAVTEGTGDHGCEYMTGGRVVILGSIGRNFAAGMSGGIAYIYDTDRKAKSHCNMSMVVLDKITEGDGFTIYNMLSKHFKYTKSPVAKNILDNFKEEIKKFVKVMPIEYKKVLEGIAVRKKVELAEVSDG